jgi:protocatechuate 3,4-dioxygenase beta subunit
MIVRGRCGRCGRVLLAIACGLLFGVPSHLRTLHAQTSAAPAPMPGGAQTSPIPGVATPTQPRPVGPRRDPIIPQTEPGTGIIRGRVVALDTGTPLRRVQLRLMGGNLRNGRSALSDAQGQFEFKELPAGRYTLMATKGGFVTLQYGQRGPTDSGKQIELADGQALPKVDMALPRGAIITGRVVDENGDPIAEVPIAALQYRLFNGRRRLMPTGRTSMTNDLGQYRLYGLAPGEYYVSAASRGGMPMGMDAPDDPSGYAPTFYPGTPNIAEAQRLALHVGEEAAADFQLVPTRLVRISGTVTDSSGKPAANGFLALQNRGADSGPMIGGGGTMVRPDGTFQLTGISPGNYQLVVQTNMGSGPNSADSREVATLPLAVSAQDISDLRITTSKGITLSGHVTYEGGTPPPQGNGGTAMRMMCMPADPESTPAMGGMSPAPANDQGQFEIKGITAPCLIRTTGPGAGWSTKAIVLNGVDVIDRPITPAGKPITGVDVILTNRVTTLTGSVTDGRGQPSKDYTVVVFPDDRDKWQNPTINQRYLRRARPDQDGLFKITALPPGNYLVVAFDTIEPGTESDPEFLEKIQSLGVKASLSEGGTQNVSLKMNSGTAQAR